MWSVGCIFAEIARGKTLWRGSSCNLWWLIVAEQQLKLIFETLGTPSKTKMASISDTFVQSKMIEAVTQIGSFQKISFDKIVKGLPKEGTRLI
jgi:mitogen-activated protein kinase 1/3